MYDASDFAKLILLIALFVSLIIGGVILLKDILVPMIQISEAESNIPAGTVVDKKIINASSGLFSSSDMDYRLVIEGEFEYKGETILGTKSVSVDKETYQQANIGDWFDIHTLEISETKNEE